MINFIKNLFRKKELEWFYFDEVRQYDLSKIPDLSPTSPIKEITITHRYKYCPENKKLMFSFYGHSNWEEHDKSTLNFKPELIKFIESCDKEYIRDKKLNKILK